ncbi:winged helix-turn-helix domain-containing protein, partial [Micromonospora zhanjiangensis]
MTEIPGRPLYEQIADDLRAKIDRGVYLVGGTLPSTNSLMQEYRASITAVRAAVNLLKQDGIVVGQPGKGVYVQRQPQLVLQQEIRSGLLERCGFVRGRGAATAESRGCVDPRYGGGCRLQ